MSVILEQSVWYPVAHAYVLVLKNVKESSVYKCAVFSYPEIVANGNSFLFLNSFLNSEFYWVLGWRILFPINDLNNLRVKRLVKLTPSKHKVWI